MRNHEGRWSADDLFDVWAVILLLLFLAVAWYLG